MDMCQCTIQCVRCVLQTILCPYSNAIIQLQWDACVLKTAAHTQIHNAIDHTNMQLLLQITRLRV